LRHFCGARTLDFSIRFDQFCGQFSVVFGVTAIMIFLALRQMNFMNQRIGSHLRLNHDA
jgi:hypothetical protein